MESAAQMIGSFFAAAFGWVVLEFIGRPLRKFYDLRGEVIRRLGEYANVSPRWREIQDDDGVPTGRLEQLKISEAEPARLKKAQEVLRDLASQMMAFAYNETCALYAANALYAAKAMRYDPRQAANGLIGLSNRIETIAPKERFCHRKAIKEGLRLRDDTPGG